MIDGRGKVLQGIAVMLPFLLALPLVAGCASSPGGLVKHGCPASLLDSLIKRDAWTIPPGMKSVSCAAGSDMAQSYIELSSTRGAVQIFLRSNDLAIDPNDEKFGIAGSVAKSQNWAIASVAPLARGMISTQGWKASVSRQFYITIDERDANIAYTYIYSNNGD